MGIFQYLFKRQPRVPPLNPMHDSVLGRLAWDEDSEGWTGVIELPSRTASLYVGDGNAHEYPGEQILSLLRVPFSQFPKLTEIGLAYLRSNMDLAEWRADPDGFQISGLESYAHYVKGGTYTVTFTNRHCSNPEAIWKVDFENLQPVGCGVDD